MNRMITTIRILTLIMGTLLFISNSSGEIVTRNACEGTPGLMPSNTIYCCSNISASVTQNGSILGAGYVYTYVLHTSSTNILGIIQDIKSNGTFPNPHDNCSTLYISYVFGPDAGSGLPDFDHSCTKVLPGTPVVWSSPIMINSSENCNPDQTYTVGYDITGGFGLRSD